MKSESWYGFGSGPSAADVACNGLPEKTTCINDIERQAINRRVRIVTGCELLPGWVSE